MRRITWRIIKFSMIFYFRYQHIHEFFIPLLKKKNNPKVFCIGYAKTGTTSLHKALRILGYRSVRLPYLPLFYKEGAERFIKKIKKCNYDAFVDYPLGMGDLYQKIDKAIPNSKFILTIRDKKSFTKSYVNFYKHSSWTEMQIKNPQKLKQLLEKYEKRNNQIIEYFKDKPSQLLVISIIEGDRWKKLCNFLDKTIPNKPFPHKNIGIYREK